MYNAYGSNVYKKYRVNMGNPYPIKPKKAPPAIINRDIAKEPDPKKEEETILENARREASQIIEKANTEANRLLEEARERMEAQVTEAEQKAKEEGYRSGEALSRQHYQELIDEAENMRKQALELYQNTVSNLENEMVETILETVRKVIGMELATNRDVIVGLIRTALLGSSLSEEVTVRVSPEDYDYALENRERVLSGIKNIRGINIQKDNFLEKGGCIVETGFGSVDSSIETQLEAVEASFRELLGDSPRNGEPAAGNKSES